MSDIYNEVHLVDASKIKSKGTCANANANANASTRKLTLTSLRTHVFTDVLTCFQ